MKHLCVAEFGSFLGMAGQRLTVKNEGKIVAEYPLNRLKSVTISKKGCSLSCSLIEACATRGIKLFIHDFRGKPCACLCGTHSHAVAEVRKKQFAFIESAKVPLLCSSFIQGKIKNQRAVLNYFAKYQKKIDEFCAEILDGASMELNTLADSLKKETLNPEKWRDRLMGYEGHAASVYFQALAQSGLIQDVSFRRIGRGASDSVNSALNYGYAILTSYIWNAVINAGLEPYAGLLHVERAGKPSLILDLMEEYRAWTVDRIIIKKRSALCQVQELTPALKKEIIAGVQETFSKKYPYKNKRLTLESILQRQVYSLSGCFAGQKQYKPFIFRW